jgi:hypothetical protein
MTHPEFLRAFALAECTEVGDDDAARLLAAASRIEELERALIPFALAGASLSSRWQDHETHWQDALPCGISAGQLRAARQALSEPSPDAPVKQIGAARYLEG